MAEAGTTRAVTTTYGYQPNGLWGTDPLFIKQGAQYGYYLNDHLGTPQRIVASNGSVLWRAKYAAFGEAQVDVNVITNNLRFPGQYFDAETGLNYNLNRTYDPSTGRYIESDPIGLDGGLNTYLYAEANPLRYTDPLGLNPGAGCIAGAWAGPAGCGVGTAIGGGIALWMIMSTPGDTPQEQCDKDDDDDGFCDERLQIELATCRALGNAERQGRVPSGSAAICYESAQARHWACKNGKPEPPFHGWPQH